MTGPADVQDSTVGGSGGSGSQQGSEAAIDSLTVPYAADDDDETPATTPTSACVTPTSALPPPSTPSTSGPTAEQLYHMMVAKTGSSRHRRSRRHTRRPHAGRMSQLESRFAASQRLRRTRSPQPSAGRLASCPPAVSSDQAGRDHVGLSSLPSSGSPITQGQLATPPQSARPRCSTGDRDTFKWSLSSGTDRKLSSASQLPNVIIDDSVIDVVIDDSVIDAQVGTPTSCIQQLNADKTHFKNFEFFYILRERVNYYQHF